MAEIKGTNLAAPIVPFTDQDVYATHEAKYGKGGFRTVANMAELNAIPAPRREEGMLAYVLEDPSGVHTYQYLDGQWVRNRIGNGIPIYTQELIDELGINPREDEYISIPSIDTDLDGEVTGKTYTTSTNGNYVDVLFQAIRALQSEVAKLRNSFTYGIESYTGKTTAMSRVAADYEEDIDEEPLWAIEEDGLSQIGDDITIGSGHTLYPAENVQVIVDEGDSYDSFLKISGTASWGAPSPITSCSDSKLFFYFTTSGMGVAMNLNGYQELDGGKLSTEAQPLKVDLGRLRLARTSSRGYYNILVVVSRNQKLSTTDTNGNPSYSWTNGQNYIWVSISDPHSDQTLGEGYWSNDNKLYTGKVEQLLRYIPDTVDFSDLTLSKFNVYSKWQDFSKQIAASKPSEEDYKFKAAHITIRSIEKQSDLSSVKDQIMNNELIWVEDTARLWIKTNNLLTAIGGGSSTDPTEDEGMTKEEMIQALQEMGIVQETNGDLSISNLNVEDITFIHQASGRRFKYSISEDGVLHSQELADESLTFAKRIGTGTTKKELVENVRGFISQLRTAEEGIRVSADARLNSDRVKIGAFYAPFKTDIVHGCSHSYVELENTSDKDYALDGCYLHLTRPDWQGKQAVYHLALTGIIPAGGTYLIRGAKHAEFDDPNVYLKVETFDQEWYYEVSTGVNELLSFEIDESFDYSGKESGYGFALTYGNDFDGTPLSHTYSLWRKSEVGTTVGMTGNTIGITSANKSKFPYFLHPYFIDGLYYYKMVTDSANTGIWASTAVNLKPNSIYRNTFELDPAKQAFQAFTTADSSRVRWDKPDNDIQVVTLNKEFIEFPHSQDSYAVANYTPKASWEHKNVSTDKTKLDKNKPNMVTTSFGIDIYKTRTFNWISVGYYDEYVWIKPKDASEWSAKFKSYIPIAELTVNSTSEEVVEASGVTTYTAVVNASLANTALMNNLTQLTVLLDADHKKIGTATSITTSGRNATIKISGMRKAEVDAKLIVTGSCFLVDPEDDVKSDSTSYPAKKFFSGDVTNNIYARITGRFPGDNSFYTSHKVIADIVGANVNDMTVYTYVVGRADKNGNPDPEHSSAPQTFTLYPATYTTRIYQVTDQQGFHWIEYQVWSAVAEKLSAKIEDDQRAANIIPILVNTGDMTQNGTRINEWFDYYQAGRTLFNHLEQMNVVGNNDLCGTDPSVLGTGDDPGKSNSFYFHLFYCYEVEEDLNKGGFIPLIKNLSNTSLAPKYVPSLYYIDSATDRFLFVNSELTETNCKEWFGAVNNGITVNVYTGFTIDNTQTYIGSFTSVYSMIYNALDKAPKLTGGNNQNARRAIVLCHEMPFTVITNDSLLNISKQYSRSMSNSSALVGSHTNQISANEKDEPTAQKNKGLYWFSRLLEYFGIKLVLGGHKHTYACTYPVRENYKWRSNPTDPSTEVSSYAGPMTMNATLQNDWVTFYDNGMNTSKFPYVKRASFNPGGANNETDRGDNLGFYPAIADPGLIGGVTYFMCQASGYKLTSNKELPSQNQKYSRILPKTTTTTSGTGDSTTYSDKADNNQKYPMFAIINVNNGSYSIKLARVAEIMSSYKFNQATYSKKEMYFQWLTEVAANNFGSWGTTENFLISSI